jgi:hypothetical protein
MAWTFLSVEDDNPIPPEYLELRENILATWLARIFIWEAEEEVKPTVQADRRNQSLVGLADCHT